MRILTPSAGSLRHHIEDALTSPEATERRADGEGRPFSAAGQLWARYLAGVPAEARPMLGRVPATGRLSLRADSMYLAGDLVDRASTFTTVPNRPNNLAQSIPADPITPWAESWTAVTAEDNGMASAFKPGSRDVQQVGYSLSETVLPVQMFAIDVVEHFGAAQQRQIAQSAAARAAGSQAEQQRRAIYAHLAAHDSLLLSGLAGFGGRSLADLDCYRETAAATYDGAPSNADDALSEVLRLARYAEVTSQGAAISPNTLIAPRRALYALERSSNFEAGGPGMAQQAVASILSGAGITQVVYADRLQGQGESGGDLAIFFNRDDPRSLRQKIGIAPAPLLTFDREGDRVTRFISSTGGLWTEDGSATLLATLPV